MEFCRLVVFGAGANGGRRQWYLIDQSVDMAHFVPAAIYWNEIGYDTGPRSTDVRAFMNDSSNYTFQIGSINRSEGAAMGIQYRAYIKN